VGNILVDYFVELTDLGRHVDTQEMKRLFHSSLAAAEPNAPVNSRLQLGNFVVDPKYTDFIGKSHCIMSEARVELQQVK
jgi:hypothetical protein